MKDFSGDGIAVLVLHRGNEGLSKGENVGFVLQQGYEGLFEWRNWGISPSSRQ